MGIANVGPRRSGAFAGRFLGTLHETTIRSELLHPREALDVMDFVEPHEAENLANAGDCAQQISGIGVMVLGGSDDGELEVTEQLSVAADECEIDVDAFVHRWIGKAFSDAVAIGLVGDLFADRRQVILAVGILHVRQECAAFACQVRASAQQVAGGAHLARIDICLRAHPAAQQNGDFMGVDRVVFGLAAMDSLHIEGMAEDKRDALVSTEVSKPVPSKHTFGRHDDLIAVGGDSLEKRFGGSLHVTVQQRFTGLVEDANIHGAGV
jgi:hypothetical protein